MKQFGYHVPRTSAIKLAVACACFLGPAVVGEAARAKTCTVDLDEIQILRKEILDIARSNVHVDKDRAAAAKRKLGDVLNGGGAVDPNDFKGILSLKGKPSPAVVQDVLARMQNIIASCQ